MVLEKFPFLEETVLGNTVLAYMIALITFIGAMLALYVLQKIVLIRLRNFIKKTAWQFDDIVLSIFEKTIVPVLYVASFYFAAKQLVLTEAVDKFVTTLAVVVLVFQGTRFGLTVAVRLLEEYWAKKATSPSGSMATKTVMTVFKVVVWGVAAVFLLDNLGFNVSAVVAGLGIGGVAVALAAQTILGDLFNYFVIFFDRPFEEGDFIIVGDYLGTVEHVGIKTTRLRSLGGELIVFSNSDLTGSRVRNYKRMRERRVLFRLGVLYKTTLDQIKKAPEIIREIIHSVKDTRFDRAHFQAFGDSSLNLEIVYYVLSPDYNKYMDIQQEINFKIKEAFEKEGLEFAFPSRSLYIESSVPVPATAASKS